MDPDERDESLQEKISCRALEGLSSDPYYAVTQLVHQNIHGRQWDEKGSIQVPPWLSPVPPPNLQRDTLLENVVRFIDGDGCLDFAQTVSNLVTEYVLPEIPCMIGVDHSLTGGVFASL
ncbi:MAG: hypothetical protein ACP5U1_05515, partial [Desulfomonilaceae bacterium]